MFPRRLDNAAFVEILIDPPPLRTSIYSTRLYHMVAVRSIQDHVHAKALGSPDVSVAPLPEPKEMCFSSVDRGKALCRQVNVSLTLLSQA